MVVAQLLRLAAMASMTTQLHRSEVEAVSLGRDCMKVAEGIFAEQNWRMQRPWRSGVTRQRSK